MMLKNSDNPLSVVHVSTTFDRRAGGIFRLFKRLRHLSDHGYQITLVVGRDYYPSPDWNLSGIAVHQVPELVKYIEPIQDIKALIQMMRVFGQIRPDVVHTHLAKAGIIVRLAAYLTNVPVIVHTVHGPTFSHTMPASRRILFRMLEKLTSWVTDFYIFVGNNLRSQYLDANIGSRDRTYVLQTGRPDAEIDRIRSLSRADLTAVRQSVTKRENAFLVICVGRVVASKNQADAIRIIFELRKLGIPAELLLVGEAYINEEKLYGQSLLELTKKLNLQAYVHFMGYRQDALDLMAASDAVLHTSRYEGLPNILVEAAFAAKPIVCYSVSGASEVIQQNRTGFVVAQGDIVDAVRRLAFLATHRGHARIMGEYARATISNDYRESTMLSKTVDVYDNIIGPALRDYRL